MVTNENKTKPAHILKTQHQTEQLHSGIYIFLQCITHTELSHIQIRAETAKWPFLSTILFMQFFVSANPSTTCCDSISRSVSDGTGGSQTAAAAAAAASFCCPSYENRLLASSRTELNAALGMYSSPYAAAAAASQNYANYFPYSTDPSAIYSTLVGSLQPQSWCAKGGWWWEDGGSCWSISRVLFINLSHTANISVPTSRLIQHPVLYCFPMEASQKSCHLEEVRGSSEEVMHRKCNSYF